MRLLDWNLEFPDPSALASQWNEVMVKKGVALSLPSASPRILDCGAHIGLVTLWARRQWPGARVVAFEADPAIAAMLRR
ncbi:hypothetical protein FK509_27210, partial [Klebsiella pneumoniae]|uniref:hypothetical protein n=1 Tax=Klebsiella pneumoniae TaxID=573 RepID=UPI00210DDAD5